MNSLYKKIGIRALIVLGILFFCMKALEWSIESEFKDRLNSNPDRKYDITYSDLDLHTFFKGVTLDEVRIEPLNPGKGALITGRVDYATLNGIVWMQFFFGKKLNLVEIAFEKPMFEVTLSTDTISTDTTSTDTTSTDTTKSTSGTGIQRMFGDILSRADLKRFRIQNGSIVINDPVSQGVKGQVKKINISATDIETDSLKFEHLIPFYLGDITIDLDSVTFKPNEYTDIKLGHFQYNLKEKEVLLNDISMGYSVDWIEVSNILGVQNDIIELNAEEIGIHQLQPSSNFYTQLDIVAQKISIDGLNIKLQRNKNIPRSPDVMKPMFQGIIKAIPMAILIDSVQISNSSLTYSELEAEKSEPGSIKIQEINGTITGITNMPIEETDKGQLEATLSASLYGRAGMNIGLSVPYDTESFAFRVDIAEMDLTSLNPTLIPLAGVEMGSGQMKKIQFHMNAGPNQSQNKLVFDYENLNVIMINEESKHGSNKKVLLSAIANTAIRTNNMPDKHNYLVAEYQSQRNIYRSPVNYIIHGLVNGFTRIVPGKGLQNLINKKDDKGKKRKGP